MARMKTALVIIQLRHLAHLSRESKDRDVPVLVHSFLSPKLFMRMIANVSSKLRCVTAQMRCTTRSLTQ